MTIEAFIYQLQRYVPIKRRSGRSLFKLVLFFKKNNFCATIREKKNSNLLLGLLSFFCWGFSSKKKENTYMKEDRPGTYVLCCYMCCVAWKKLGYIVACFEKKRRIQNKYVLLCKGWSWSGQSQSTLFWEFLIPLVSLRRQTI